MAGLYSAIWAVLGILTGILLNVLIWRIPREETLLRRRHTCIVCGRPLKSDEEHSSLPVHILRSVYAYLHGKCCECGTEINWRNPAVELLNGALFTLTYLGHHQRALSGLVMDTLFVELMILLAFIDLEHYILPDRLVVLVALLGLINAAASGDSAFKNSLIGGLCTGLFFLLIVWLYPQGMGFGDVKFVAALGLFLGISVVPAVFIASILGVVVCGFCVLFKKRGLRDPIPFGPFLAFGAVLVHLLKMQQSWSFWV